MLNPLVSIAEDALRSWHGADITRETATALLPSWRWAHVLTDVEREELLRLFPLDEPVMVAGRDFLPIEHGVKSARPTRRGGYFIECHCEWDIVSTGDTARLSAESLFREHLAEVDAVVPA